jgi:hypothetical protein
MGGIGKLIIVIGIVMIVFGGIVLLVSHLTHGRGAPLPGDIVIRRQNVTIYFPIITSIVLSVLLTLLLWLFSAFRR